MSKFIIRAEKVHNAKKSLVIVDCFREGHHETHLQLCVKEFESLTGEILEYGRGIFFDVELSRRLKSGKDPRCEKADETPSTGP